MTKLLILLTVVVLLAHLSQQRTTVCSLSGVHYRSSRDSAYIVLIVVLVLFAGLRTSYNDTENYIRGFRDAPLLVEFFLAPDSYNIFKNPLFYLIQSLLKSISNNPQYLIFLSSAFTQCCFVRFFKCYSTNFTFTMFLYLTYGTYCFSMAAMKQVLAMAVITLAIPFLEKKKYIKFFLLVFVAMLIHTYALVFLFLPIFRRKPWTFPTFLLIVALILIMINFEAAITNFMEQANEAGKTLADYEVFDAHTINILRLMIYIAVPFISLVFSRRLFVHSNIKENLLVHMSIFSMAFMCMGTQAGANMFARMATYFELGTLCCLPWILEKIFNERSYKVITIIISFLFLLYFIYDFGINMDFNLTYKSVPIWRLFII